MAIRGDARTLGADVYQQIREGILNGRITPGSRLRPSEMRTEYNVSVSVVREALTRLTEQQLVVAEANLGFSVAPLSRSHLMHIVEARTEVEGFTIRLSVEHGDLDWETGVIAAHHRLERTAVALPDGGINPEWHGPHAAFHAQLLAGCRNPVLLSICDSLFQSAQLYRAWSDPMLVHRDAAAEHKALAEAALGRRAEEASSLLKQHIERTRDLALENIAALRTSTEA